MYKFSFKILVLFLMICLISCNEGTNNVKKVRLQHNKKTLPQKDSMSIDSVKNTKEKPFLLTDENAIPFFFEYQKKHQEHLVKVYTSMGSFTIDLYKKTPYHRSNFIYLSRKEYFNNTYFHRVVKNFIIQGGNTDLMETAKKRKKIGYYLLPPDTKKGYTHKRGVVSMPSSDDVTNPHKLASPYEFFIVTAKRGAHHLDGTYTAFGKVQSGMDVVDKINNVATEDEWPLTNVVIDSVKILK